MARTQTSDPADFRSQLAPAARVQVTAVIDVPHQHFPEGRRDTTMTLVSAGKVPISQPLTRRTP